MLRAPPPLSSGFIKLLAGRHPVLSHFFSQGLAAEGRPNTIIFMGKQLERGNRGITQCPTLAQLFLRAVGGEAVGGPHTQALPWCRGNSAHLVGWRPPGLQPLTQVSSAQCSVSSPVWCQNPSSPDTGTWSHSSTWIYLDQVPCEHLGISKQGSEGFHVRACVQGMAFSKLCPPNC